MTNANLLFFPFASHLLTIIGAIKHVKFGFEIVGDMTKP